MFDSVDLMIDHEDEEPYLRVSLKGYEEACDAAEEDFSAEILEKIIIKNSGIPREFLIFPDDLDYWLGKMHGPWESGVCDDIKISPEYFSQKEKPTKALLEDLSKLLNDQDTTDFTLKTKTKNFRIHKLIFGARSCVFQAMFQSDMTEALAGETTIEDLDDDTLEEMIHFVYTGSLSGKQFDKVSLLYAARKYQLDSLLDLIVLNMKAATEPGEIADIFIASKLIENLFEIAIEMVWDIDFKMLEDARFKEKMEDHPMLFSKIKEKFVKVLPPNV